MKRDQLMDFDSVKEMDLDEVEELMIDHQLEIKSMEQQIEWQEITNPDVDKGWLARCKKAIKWKEMHLMVLGKRKKQLRRIAIRDRNDNYEAFLLELFMREADQDLIDRLAARAEQAYPKIHSEDYRIQDVAI